MRKKSRLAVVIIYKNGKSPRHIVKGFNDIRIMTTSMFHAFVAELNKSKTIESVMVRRVLICFLLGALLTGCFSRHISRSQKFEANKQVETRLLSYEWLVQGRVQIDVLTVCGDTIHYLTRGSRAITKHWQYGDRFTFSYDSTRMSHLDTLPGTLIYHPKK